MTTKTKLKEVTKIELDAFIATNPCIRETIRFGEPPMTFFFSKSYYFVQMERKQPPDYSEAFAKVIHDWDVKTGEDCWKYFIKDRT